MYFKIIYNTQTRFLEKNSNSVSIDSFLQICTQLNGRQCVVLSSRQKILKGSSIRRPHHMIPNFTEIPAVCQRCINWLCLTGLHSMTMFHQRTQKSQMDPTKAIEIGMILLVMDIKEYFYVFFQRPIIFGV